MPKRRERPAIASTRCTTRCTDEDVLECAYVRCRANDGAPGVDGQTFEDIEAYGRERWLDELATELRSEDVSTATGATRVHPETGWQATAAGDRFDPGSRGADGRGSGPGADLRGRPGAGAIRLPSQTAARWTPCRQSMGWSARGIRKWSMPICRATSTDPARRTPASRSPAAISDRHLLGLIKMWLEAPVEETDERGRHHRTTRNKDEGRGSPQGSPLSPLLANIYMRRFVLGWKTLGHERRLEAHIVNYADDLRDLLSGHGR